jgi:hypothetical protein
MANSDTGAGDNSGNYQKKADPFSGNSLAAELAELAAIEKSYLDANREVPSHIADRLAALRDLNPSAPSIYLARIRRIFLQSFDARELFLRIKKEKPSLWRCTQYGPFTYSDWLAIFELLGLGQGWYDEAESEKPATVKTKSVRVNMGDFRAACRRAAAGQAFEMVQRPPALPAGLDELLSTWSERRDALLLGTEPAQGQTTTAAFELTRCMAELAALLGKGPSDV